jgi:hypothetical protein
MNKEESLYNLLSVDSAKKLVEDLYLEFQKHPKYKEVFIKNEKGEILLNPEYADLWENYKNITPDNTIK